MRERQTWLWPACVAVVFVGSATAGIVACGDSSVVPGVSDDGGAEAATGDASVDPGSDTDSGNAADGSVADASDDADGGCGADNTACMLNGATAGLCKAGACAACSDPTDDSNCTTAYGTAATPYLCAAGTCSPGSCRANGDCKDVGGTANGQICGIGAANTCSKCTADSQCQGSYGASFICNTTTGGCVSGTCTTPKAVCGANGADICCPSGGGNQCSPGTNCCTSGDCSGTPATPNCNAGTCSACLPVAAPGPFVVDPSTSTDSGRTGGGGACAFKTLKAAVAYVSALNLVAPASATIKVLDTAPLGAGETFPIAIPALVTVTGVAGAVPVLQVPAGSVGFSMAATSSKLSYFTIDGQTNQGLTGIVAISGSTVTTSLDHVTVKNMKSDGIVVRNAAASAVGGVLSIGPGVVSTGNGTATARASGLAVRGAGKVAISDGGNANADHTTFTANTEHGIIVTELGSVSIAGTLGATPVTTATVSANANYVAGLWISNTPGAAAPMNSVAGFAIWNTTNGNGMHLSGGTKVRLRGSSILGNAGSGLRVDSYVNGATTVDDTSGIDLGASAGDPGKNVFQAPLGMSPNANAGICLAITKNVGQVMAAYGNTFAQGVGFVDCSANPANPVLTHNTTCGGATDVSVSGPATNSNTIVTLACTQP